MIANVKERIESLCTKDRSEANKRTNMIISVRKSKKHRKSFVSRQEKEVFNRDIWEYSSKREMRKFKFW